MMDYKNLFADERKKRELAEYIVHVLKVTIQVYNMNSSIVRFISSMRVEPAHGRC